MLIIIFCFACLQTNVKKMAPQTQMMISPYFGDNWEFHLGGRGTSIIENMSELPDCIPILKLGPPAELENWSISLID